MHQFFAEESQIDKEGGRVILTGEDVNHIRNVLRMKPGEEIAVRCGTDGKEYRCAVLALEADRVVCELRFIRKAGTELPSRVHLFQGLPKADKMELIIQKTVELGVYEIIPVETARSVVKLDAGRAEQKVKRWQAVAEAAAKQSMRGMVPAVRLPMSFEQALREAAHMDVRLIPYELAEGMEKTKEIFSSLPSDADIAVLIGPEGGFTKEEVERAAACGIQPVTLGKRILRTETAGLTVMAWVMYQLEK